MKTFACIALFLSFVNQLSAEDARLTREQVKEIATLVGKEIYNEDPESMEVKYRQGTWLCLFKHPIGGLALEIRDSDAKYRAVGSAGAGSFKINTSLKRRIAKITGKKG